MRRACAALALSVWLGGNIALCAQKPLTDAQLDKITAGSAGANVSNSATGSGGGSVVVGGNSSATVVTNSKVSLAASAPGDSQVLNLTNASTSSVANGINVWDAQSVGRAAGADQVNQANTVFQSGKTSASVARWSLNGRIISETSHFSFFSQSSSSSLMTNKVIDQSFSSRSSVVNTQDTVPSYFPFNSILHIGKIAPNPFTIPKFGFHVNTIVSTDDGKFGAAVAGSVGPFHVSPGAVDFGSLDLSSPTLTLSGGSITLPSISGAASGFGVICAGTCSSASGSGTFTEDGSALGKISFPSVSLGTNPFSNFKVQAGGGVVGAGSGTMSAGAGSAGANLKVSLQIPPVTGKSLTIGGPVDLGPLGTIDIPETKVNLPPITFPKFTTTIPLVNTSVGGFNASFHDAAFCLNATGNSTQCGEISARFQDTSYHNHSSSSSHTMTSSSQQSSTSQISRQIIYPAVLLGAQGGYLALTGGKLNSASNSSVTLSGPVQQGLSAVNLVNAAQSALVNGMNVAASPAMGSALQLSQANLVAQIK